MGQGGASGYLAVMAFFDFAPRELSTTALILNILVAGTSFAFYREAGYFNRALLIPFLITSVPAAFLGGLLPVRKRYFSYLLAGLLIFAAVRLSGKDEPDTATAERRAPALWIELLAGAVIGLLSGIVGLGGGIFLSGLLLLAKWCGTKEAAAVTAPFIVINSAAGLAGRAVQEKFFPAPSLPHLCTAFLGGALGSYFGSRKFAGLLLRRLLAVALIFAALKLFLSPMG